MSKEDFDDVEDYSSNLEDYSDTGLAQPNIAAGNHDQLPSVESVRMTMGGGSGRSIKRKYMLGFGLAILAVGFLAVVLGGGGNKGPALGDLDVEQALEHVQEEAGGDIENKDSYQYAAAWHLRPDEMVTHYSYDKFKQRYGMYCLYFATGHEFWVDDKGWRRMGTDECDWFGVMCNEQGMVTRIELRNNNLSGNIPPEVSLIEELEVLTVKANDLSGHVPSPVCELQQSSGRELHIKVDCNAVSCACCSDC